jgi:hypothetical protein
VPEYLFLGPRDIIYNNIFLLPSVRVPNSRW